MIPVSFPLLFVSYLTACDLKLCFDNASKESGASVSSKQLLILWFPTSKLTV